jgi:TPR repeat protein
MITHPEPRITQSHHAVRTAIAVAFGILLLAACGEADLSDPQAAYASGDYPRAAKLWREAARAGDPDAQNWLANLYYLGMGVRRDFRRAAHWYERAARRGHSGAQRNLGNLYRLGQGVQQDNLHAYLWYYAASQNGNETASIYLAMLDSKVTPNARMQGRALLQRYLREGDLEQQLGM